MVQIQFDKNAIQGVVEAYSALLEELMVWIDDLPEVT